MFPIFPGKCDCRQGWEIISHPCLQSHVSCCGGAATRRDRESLLHGRSTWKNDYRVFSVSQAEQLTV